LSVDHNGAFLNFTVQFPPIFYKLERCLSCYFRLDLTSTPHITAGDIPKTKYKQYRQLFLFNFIKI